MGPRRHAGRESRSLRVGRAIPRRSVCGTRRGVVLALPLLLGVTTPGSAPAQTARPIIVSLGTHALTVPWHPGALTTRWDPAVQVGTEHAFRSGDRWTFTFGLSLGFFRDRWWMTGLSVVPELGVGRRLPGGLHADVALGLGYLHYFWRRRTLALEDGNYVPTRSWGKPSAILPLSFTLGYRGAPGHPLTISPFVSMRWGVQGLFLAEVPAMTHLSLLGGVRIRRRTTAADEGG